MEVYGLLTYIIFEILHESYIFCQAFRYPKNDPNGAKALWTEIASHGIPAPDCRESQFSRDNHLGNGIGGQPLVYNWTIPNTLNHEQCVMRMRWVTREMSVQMSISDDDMILTFNGLLLQIGTWMESCLIGTTCLPHLSIHIVSSGL